MTTFKFPYLWMHIQAFYAWAHEAEDLSYSVEFVVNEEGYSNMIVTTSDEMTALLIKMEFAGIILETIK
jgi:hypothetical protein